MPHKPSIQILPIKHYKCPQLPRLVQGCFNGFVLPVEHNFSQELLSVKTCPKMPHSTKRVTLDIKNFVSSGPIFYPSDLKTLLALRKR